MSRRWLIGAIGVLVLGGCTSKGRPSPDWTAVPPPVSVILTATSPTVRVLATVRPQTPIFELRVESVVNPARQAVEIRAAIAVGKDPKGRELEIGRASLFPFDRPGVFTMRLSDEIENALGASGGEHELVVGLLPGRAGSRLSDALRVRVSWVLRAER